MPAYFGGLFDGNPSENRLLEGFPNGISDGKRVRILLVGKTAKPVKNFIGKSIEKTPTNDYSVENRTYFCTL